jgi:peptide-methionine (R)-S-oxide reductase
MGATRVGVGVAFLAAPRVMAAGCVGPETAAEPRLDALVRAVGVRELVLGAGIVSALARGRPVRKWLVAGVVADLADVAATVAFRDRLPKEKAAVVAATALGSAATGAHFVYHLER